MMLGKWATVAGLAMTPALFAGPMAAFGAGIGFGLDARIMIPVVAASGFVEGMFVAWLAGRASRIGAVGRFIERRRTPRAMAAAKRWGVWGGMTFGVAMLGQEPVLIALRALDVSMKRLILPVALSNAVFSVIWFVIVHFGVDQYLKVDQLVKSLTP